MALLGIPWSRSLGKLDGGVGEAIWRLAENRVAGPRYLPGNSKALDLV
jgi:hypothetical protein